MVSRSVLISTNISALPQYLVVRCTRGIRTSCTNNNPANLHASLRASGFGFVRSTKKETDTLLWCLSLFLVRQGIAMSNRELIDFSFAWQNRRRQSPLPSHYIAKSAEYVLMQERNFRQTTLFPFLLRERMGADLQFFQRSHLQALNQTTHRKATRIG